MNKYKLLAMVLICFSMLGCAATAPRGSTALEMQQKQFFQPDQNSVALYIYRGQEGLLNQDVITKRKIWVNGDELGSLIANSYFYTTTSEGVITIETESEFGKNELTFQADGGRIYFVEQNLKMGVLVSGADLKLAYDKKGKEAILSSRLLKKQ